MIDEQLARAGVVWYIAGWPGSPSARLAFRSCPNYLPDCWAQACYAVPWMNEIRFAGPSPIGASVA